MTKPRGPYRKQGRKYEAILEGIRAIARDHVRIKRSSHALDYRRLDYRRAYIEAYVAALNSAAATED